MDFNLNKVIYPLILVSAAFVFSSLNLEVKADKDLSYSTVIEIEDWGPAITEVLVDLGTEVPFDAVTVDTFNVDVLLTDDRLDTPTVAEGTRTVIDAYVSDAGGNKLESGTGTYAVLKMEIGPTVTLGNAMNYDFAGTGHNDWIDYSYTITQKEDITTEDQPVSGLVIDTLAKETRKIVDQFDTGEATYGDKTLTYVDYSPEEDGKKNPLVIWLHGAGEGGTDPTVAISGNKAVNFISDENQSHFEDAYVLAPQTPTMWMDGFDGFGDGTSIYQDTLMSLIEDYVANNPDIDPNRIYLGGDSNGGYMTMLMLRDYPDYFAAGFPTCEPLADDLLTDDDIVALAKTPMWFTHAKSDTVVDPENNTIPTYERLKKAGAEVYLSLYDNVVDQTGLYTEEDGNPYEYMGHFSWIYVYNNDPTQVIDGEEITLLEWLASKTNELNSYETVVSIEDWGPAVTKVIVDLGEDVPTNTVDESTFKVHVSRNDARLDPSFLEDGYRTIRDSYVSDVDGNPVSEGTGSYAVIEMTYGPNISLSSPMNYDFTGTGHNDWIDYNVTVYQVEDIITESKTIKGLVMNDFAGERRLLVDDFNTGTKTYEDTTLAYADYSPPEDDGKNPLFIWLHGAGEGGTDPTVAIGGNKVVNFITDDIQEHLDNAYILAPQTPTMWMDGFDRFGDGTSIYQDALKLLIEDYVENNPDIDPNRIYLGGDSNGGYMTMLMLRDYPDYFAAGIPTCEALQDDLITDEGIASLAKTPIWFVHAKNDTTVDPKTTVIPTYERLLDKGADVHISLYDNVVDKTGLYTDENGDPYEYMGHFSWIYVYNNDPTTIIDGESISIMEWLGDQTLAENNTGDESNENGSVNNDEEIVGEQDSNHQDADSPITNEDVEKDKKEKDENEGKFSEKKLPNTATSTFNYLAIGFIVLTIAGVLLYLQNRRKN
ncbi:hypothetical protein Pryu01_01442 [Paraliobacillus ryukyuensis]|uniref:LPXTG-motif cell wall-anchored protein n=1 Tax=Paraliobacillus ryukyuensis TaxID=200904 RepID=A0A366ECJ3_9BACI|nr:prolyl oligopeptidase family serine peptidase [Paraliobacillus ryukyuensis]RBO99785.1 LPXTG-motif cell wall-anchored protein [Paraliobacillus ryukyuensis]